MIAITGASGFLGRHTAALPQGKHFPIRCLVRENSPRLKELQSITPKCQWVDYSNPESIENGLKGCDTVIHTLGVINADEKTLKEVNEGITRRLLEAAKKVGCRKIILISSVAAAMRHGAYGISKYNGELLLKEAGIPYTILRPAYIYGQGDENSTALLLRTLRRWPVVPLLGGGSFKLQPVFVEDAAQVILKAVELPPQNAEFNIAGPAQVSLKSMLQELSQALGVQRTFLPIPLKPVQALVRIFLIFFPRTKLPAKQILELDKHEAFDISKTSEVFNFHPIPYTQGVKKMFGGNPSCAA